MTSRIEQAYELLRAELHAGGRSPQHLHGDLIALRDLVVAANTLAVWKANLAAGTGQHPREVSTMRTVPVKRGIRTHRRRRAGLWRWGHSVPKHVRLGLPGPTFDA